jgi:hypothetical protein
VCVGAPSSRFRFAQTHTLAEFHAKRDYRKIGGPPRATGYEGAIYGLEMCTTRYEHPVDVMKNVRGVGFTIYER